MGPNVLAKLHVPAEVADKLIVHSPRNGSSIRLRRRASRLLQLIVLGSAALHTAFRGTSSLAQAGTANAAAPPPALPPPADGGGAPPNSSSSLLDLPKGTLGTGAFLLFVIICYGSSYASAKRLLAAEANTPEPAASGEKKKKPRIDAFDSLRFFLIAYIASGHFIATSTSNPVLLKLTTQINVVVGAFFVLSGYVAAYTTTELGERKGSARLNNAVEFAVTRIMGFWPLHLMVLFLFSWVFIWVDVSFNGPITALWHGFLSVMMLQAWFPASGEIWNAPTWFLSAFAFCLIVLPYGLRLLALQKKSELRRTLVFLAVLCFLPRLGYSDDLKAWDILEGTLSAKKHPNYLLFNAVRFSPFLASLEVLMGATACRLVMLDSEQDSGKTDSPMWPLIGMLSIIGLRATGIITMNDMLVRSIAFIPLWIVFLMRLHRQSTGPGGAQKMLPNLLCRPALLFLGGISFPIFIVHGPIGQVFFKKAVAKKLWGGMLAQPRPDGIHWFFGVYWVAVLLMAILLQKCFVESSKVKEASKRLQGAILGQFVG